MGETVNEFDVVVVGAGPGGYVCAIRAAQLGMKVACVESRETLGGTCLNVGCIPSKALLESSHHFHRVKHGLAVHGIDAAGVTLSVERMQARKRDVVAGITKGVEGLFAKNKVRRFHGFARFDASGDILVDLAAGGNERLRAKHVVIATGSVPAALPHVPFDHDVVVDSTGALSFAEVPTSLVVVGGGVIGLELGSVWARLGSQVTVVEVLPRILSGMDGEVSTQMERLLSRQGMTFHTGTRLESLKRIPEGAVITCRKGDEVFEINSEKVLVAAGRRPFVSGLGLEGVGIALSPDGRIPVDGRFETCRKGVYAIGDVVSGQMLAHKAEEEGIAVAENLAGRSGHVNSRALPGIVYTWPEVASVGLSEEECQQQGLVIRKGKFAFRANGRARAMDEAEGFVKVLADAASDKVLGVHIVGANASEIIGEAVVAFEFEASAEDLARSFHAHPTLCEAIKEAALAVDGRAIHA